MKTLLIAAALTLLPACASNPHEDPFCLVYENGQPVRFGFKPSKAQAAAFNRDRDRGALFKRQEPGGAR